MIALYIILTLFALELTVGLITTIENGVSMDQLEHIIMDTLLYILLVLYFATMGFSLGFMIGLIL